MADAQHVFYFSLLVLTCPFSLTDLQPRNWFYSISTFRSSETGISSTGSLGKNTHQRKKKLRSHGMLIIEASRLEMLISKGLE